MDDILEKFEQEIANINDIQQLGDLKVSYLGKKGIVTGLMKNLQNLSLEQKKQQGGKINQIKVQIGQKLNQKQEQINLDLLNEKLKSEKIDVTLPYRKNNIGSIHTLSKVIQEVKEIFSHLGFEIAQGPEIEDDFHNFEALNIPKNHPARQMQDSFYFKDQEYLLRTHTSSVQIRKMKKIGAPTKIISIGKVYRNDSDQTHSPMFHQVEALAIDENINMGNLRFILNEFLINFFEIKDIDLRFRPSFFPFTEPSAEVDIGYKQENGVIKIGGSENFMEILGCGMVHPNVLENVEIDSKKYQGFAFGIGIERLAMLKYGISDLRSFFDNDLRFLKHYGF